MSALTSFAVNDRESTPVGHTFTPVDNPNGLARFIEAGVVPIADRVYSMSWKKTALRAKVRAVLSDPKVVTETINGVDSTKVMWKNHAEVIFNFDTRSTLQDRKNIVGMLANSLLESVGVLDDTFTGLEAVY